jgi:hypothetical protein
MIGFSSQVTLYTDIEHGLGFEPRMSILRFLAGLQNQCYTIKRSVHVVQWERFELSRKSSLVIYVCLLHHHCIVPWEGLAPSCPKTLPSKGSVYAFHHQGILRSFTPTTAGLMGNVPVLLYNHPQLL